MIALGPHVRWPLVSAFAAVNVVANLTTQIAYVTLGQTFMFVVGNVAEPLIIATLVERYFGENISLNRARDLFGLFAIACFGIIVTVTWYASAFKLLLDPSISFLTIWLDFFLGHIVGFLTIAPFVIGFFAAIRNPPPRSELFEGAVALVLVGSTAGIIVSLPPQHWDTVTPVALLFPVFLWLAVRCRPVFAAAGVFVLSMSIVWMTSFGIGHFGDARLSVSDRILQIQAIILVAAIGALVLATLFAERKQIAERLAQSNMMLERERDNKLMNAQAITAAIAHEIRQPLTRITAGGGAAQRFLKMAPPQLDKAQAALGGVVDAGHRTSAVIEGFRSLFGEADEERQLVDMNELIPEVLESLYSQLEDHHVSVRVDLTPKLPPVTGNKGQLQEVVSNLIINSIEAMETTTVQSRELRIRTEIRGDNIAVTVEDSGPGIDKDQLGGIFTAFFTTKPHGMGLGLAISRMIIDYHGGKLIASSDGKYGGASFQFILPVASVDKDATRTEKKDWAANG
jgi:signal transduction histidine kinase